MISRWFFRPTRIWDRGIQWLTDDSFKGWVLGGAILLVATIVPLLVFVGNDADQTKSAQSDRCRHPWGADVLTRYFAPGWKDGDCAYSYLGIVLVCCFMGIYMIGGAIFLLMPAEKANRNAEPQMNAAAKARPGAAYLTLVSERGGAQPAAVCDATATPSVVRLGQGR